MGLPKLTSIRANEKLDAQHRKNIRCVGDPQGYTKKVEWKCHRCDHTWHSTPHVVITQKHGCPNCNKISNESIDHNLQDSPINRVGNFTYAHVPIEWECSTCRYTWNARPTKILNGYTKCPNCSNKAHLTNTKVDTRLLETDRDIVRIGDVINTSTKIEWECNSSHTWMASPRSILINNTGCPHCYAKLGGSGIPTTVNSIYFRSKLEANMYTELITYTNSNNTTLELQKRYNDKTQHTCDFYIPELAMWIEVSNFTSIKYIDNINKKRKWVENINQSFYFVENMKQLLTLID